MKKISVIVFLILVVSGVSSGCSFAPVAESGQKVRVLTIDEVASCRKLGTTGASVLSTLAGIKRPPETIAKELENVARNAAGGMGGDTIVPKSAIHQGQRTFFVYKCVNPDG